jgi:anti-anti-sigma regulatory factor
MRNAARLWEQTRAAYVAPGPRALLIDLTDALFLESMTVAVLLEVAKDAARRQVELGIVVGRGSVARRVLTLARVDELLNLFDTGADALETLLGRSAT